MPLNLFDTMVQKSQKRPKTQIKGGGPALIHKQKSLQKRSLGPTNRIKRPWRDTNKFAVQARTCVRSLKMNTFNIEFLSFATSQAVLDHNRLHLTGRKAQRLAPSIEMTLLPAHFQNLLTCLICMHATWRRKHNLGHPVTRLPSQWKLPTRRPHTTPHSGAHRVEEEPTQKTLVQTGTRPASVARRRDTSSLCGRLGSPRTRLADYKYVHCRLTPTPSQLTPSCQWQRPRPRSHVQRTREVTWTPSASCTWKSWEVNVKICGKILAKFMSPMAKNCRPLARSKPLWDFMTLYSTRRFTCTRDWLTPYCRNHHWWHWNCCRKIGHPRVRSSRHEPSQLTRRQMTSPRSGRICSMNSATCSTALNWNPWLAHPWISACIPTLRQHAHIMHGPYHMHFGNKWRSN